MSLKKVAVIMGSDSDWPVVKGCCAQLKAYGIPFEARVMSAHRTPAEAAAFAKSAADEGFGVLIAAAGMAAHLAGALAANTTLRSSASPSRAARWTGWTPCSPPCRCPRASPWPPLAINGAKNAAVLAAQMLALSDDALAARLRAERADMAKTIAKKNEALQAEVAAL